MEKPTGTIQKIIESLQRINALDVYSPIEKDTILHYLRAAYMNFLNISTDENITDNRVGTLTIEEAPPFSEDPLFTEAPLVAEKILYDDLLEFIPDAKPKSGLLFEETDIPRYEKKSLNDLLTEKKEDHSLGVRFQQSFIPDLTKAIAINEKFTFIRELFSNSGVDFSNAIQKLNECENIDSAFVLMEELKHQYLWDTTSTSYLSLCDLVRRRFL